MILESEIKNAKRLILKFSIIMAFLDGLFYFWGEKLGSAELAGFVILVAFTLVTFGLFVLYLISPSRAAKLLKPY